MTANIAFNYMPTTVAQGTFNVTSTGQVQGVYLPDPAIRYQLFGGVLATTETIPMWGGVGINETVTPNGASSTKPPADSLGGLITRATSVTAGAAGQLTGFSVFDQAYGMAITPQSPVPLAGSNMSVHLFRLGSNARIPVACASSLTSLETGTITQQVSWDFSLQQLIPYIAAYASASVSSVTYNSTTGILSLTFGAAPFGAGVGSTANGVPIAISGITGGAVNGTWPITSTGTSGTVINVQIPSGLGSLTLSGGTLAAGGGALPVKVLDIQAGNSMVVVWNGTNATWNYSGTIAVIQI